MKDSLRNARILMLLFIFLLALCTVFSFITLETQASGALFDITRADLKGSASIIASQLPGDNFTNIRPGNESTPAYTSLRDTLNTIRQSDSSILNIYTMRLNGSVVEFVVDADYGISPDGAPIGEIYPNPTADLLAGFLQPSAETEFTTDKWGTTLSGFAPIQDGEGQVVGLVGVDMDSQRVIGRMHFVSMITYALLIIILVLVSVGTILFDIRRARSEIMIEAANEKLNVLNSLIRHDISNTLTALIGYEDMAKETKTMPEFQEKLTTIATLTQKIQQQISFTRDYQDLGLSQPKWQNVQDIITKEASGLDFSSGTIALDFANLEIYADPLITRVFYHLLDNAIRHGQTITKIHGYYQRSGSTIILVIEDDGIGIPENEKEGIFKRKFYKNTGLGLFLTREILSMTDLSIRESGIPGKGARFEIMVPKGKYRFL